MLPLSCVTSERGVLSGIINYGSDAYYEIYNFVSENTFTIDSNQYIFKCIQYIMQHDSKSARVDIDIPTIHSAATSLGLRDILFKKDEVDHLKAIINFPVKFDNVRKLATKIRKLEIARQLRKQLELASNDLLEVDGSESIVEILNKAEEPIFDLSALLKDSDNTPKKIGEGLREYIQSLRENPVDHIYIPSGYSIWDEATGGFAPATVTFIASRMKIGKSTLGLNFAKNVSGLGVPVLVLDTELVKKMNQNRLTANYSEISINKIKNGQFSKIQEEDRKIEEAVNNIEKLPYYHYNISGLPFENQIACMRNWLIKEVGLNQDGTAKPCLIIYDYIKLMDSKDIKSTLNEHQIIGFMMTTLHNFAVRYNIPLCVFGQTNRANVEKSDSSVIGLSDRIAQLATSISLFVQPKDEEIQELGPSAKNRKMYVIAARDAPALDYGDYIMFDFQGWMGKIVEGKTRSQILAEKKNNEDFKVDNDIDFGDDNE